MERVLNFDCSLVAYARRVNGKDFEWGNTDCAALVRGAMLAMYGTDVFKAVPRWKSLSGARRVCGAPEKARQILFDAGAVLIPTNYEQPGDIVLSPGTDSVGLPQFAVILTAGQALVSTPESGVAVVAHWTSIRTDDTEIYRMPHGE